MDTTRLGESLRYLGITLSSEQVHQLIEAADPAATGGISYRVFAAMAGTLVDGHCWTLSKQDLSKAFKQADKADAGSIRVSEFRHAAAIVGLDGDESELAMLLQTIDPDCAGVVTAENLIQHLCSNDAPDAFGSKNGPNA